MTLYVVGDRVFHPFYGAGTVTGVEPKRIAGQRRRYYVIDMVMDAMQIMVPVDRVGAIGLRRVGSGERLEAMLYTVDEIPEIGEMRGTARRARQAEMRERLKSGSFAQIVETVRELHVMHEARPLGMMDRQLFEQGKRFLAGELVLVLEVEKEEALKAVERSLSIMMEAQERLTQS